MLLFVFDNRAITPGISKCYGLLIFCRQLGKQCMAIFIELFPTNVFARVSPKDNSRSYLHVHLYSQCLQKTADHICMYIYTPRVSKRQQQIIFTCTYIYSHSLQKIMADHIYMYICMYIYVVLFKLVTHKRILTKRKSFVHVIYI